MRKNYQQWMPIKSAIHNGKTYPVGYKERDIWLASVGENIGFEEDGKGEKYLRPVLILKIFNRQLCHAVPLSTTEKRGKFYHAFDGGTGRTSVAILSQSRALDSSRLRRKVGVAAEQDFIDIRKQIREVLALP
jgi:mRNA interferase MazF